MLEKAAPLLLPLPPLALTPAALLLRPLLPLLDSGLQILIKLNNFKICQIPINLNIFTKITLFQNAPGDARQEPPQSAPYARHQRVIFGPTQ